MIQIRPAQFIVQKNLFHSVILYYFTICSNFIVVFIVSALEILKKNGNNKTQNNLTVFVIDFS